MKNRLLALRRKLETATRAGLKEKAALLRANIEAFEAILENAAEPEPQTVQKVEEEEQAEAPAGVVLTPAAQARSDELGLTPEDYLNHQPSGKAGEFLVSDVQRIAEAKAHTEEDDNGDD